MQAEIGLPWLALEHWAADNINRTPDPQHQNSHKGQRRTAEIMFKWLGTVPSVKSEEGKQVILNVREFQVCCICGSWADCHHKLVLLCFFRASCYEKQVVSFQLNAVVFTNTNNFLFVYLFVLLSIYSQTFSEGRHSVRISGLSTIDFRAGFSRRQTLDFKMTSSRPVQGELVF